MITIHNINLEAEKAIKSYFNSKGYTIYDHAYVVLGEELKVEETGGGYFYNGRRVSRAYANKARGNVPYVTITQTIYVTPSFLETNFISLNEQ